MDKHALRGCSKLPDVDCVNALGRAGPDNPVHRGEFLHRGDNFQTAFLRIEGRARLEHPIKARGRHGGVPLGPCINVGLYLPDGFQRGHQ